MKNKTLVSSLSVIIPTLTNTAGLKRLINFLNELQLPIIIIDNQPTEDKKRFIQSLITSHQSQITYLPQKQNTGFAKAVNLGANEAKTKWLLILNDDVIINDTNLFDRLIHFAERHDFCAVSPVLKNTEGMIENLGYRVLPIGRVELNFEKNEFIDQRNIDGLTAACLLIQKSVYDIVGGFDERFFAYLEDVDLFLRLKKRDYRFGVDLDTQIIHDSHKTSSKMGNFKQKQDLKNWLLIIGKNWDKKILIRYFPQIVLERLRNVSGYIKSFSLNQQGHDNI